jgi:hypothetical protein
MLNFISPYGSAWRSVLPLLSTAALVTLTSCSTTTVNQYDATARVTYTWQVQYSPNLGGERRPRIEKFASTSLLNQNGVRPDDAVTGPDDRGLWFPALPPRPTVDEMEERQQGSNEEMSQPELITTEEYFLSFEDGGLTRTLPTSYAVYRQAIRAYADQRPIELTFGVNEGSITKVEPQ